ncbi:ATPase F1 complex OSCP/delta subunit [Rickenella mellea]|uniref:ATP synthase subunit 5, mitochondrial n=1 Tax=Rickenella mellea TaxID=50990 RepID=A0A4Y7Q1Z7_9AGAM|nr:ATPase F1 complex OSCP/delta subunit [Rickenella mellea]
MLAAGRVLAKPNTLGRRAASTIALKCSQAVYSAALSKSPQTLNKVQTELASISSSIKDVPALNTYIHNPTLSAKDRAAGLDSLFKAASEREPVSDVTKNLFLVLSENGRLGETEGDIDGFNALVSKYKGELEVTVTSAAPLTKDVLTRLESTLKQSQLAQQAKVLKVTNKVNPSVLGGLMVDFGHKTTDLSAASRVNKLNNLLQQSV